MAMLNIGDTAPPLRLVNQDGAVVDLKDLAGRQVVLWWYPKADTPG